MKIWRACAALIVWGGVILQLWLMIHGKAGAELGQAVVRFFSFFTILSNLAVGVLLSALVLAPATSLGRWVARAGTRVAVAVYIAVTAAIYHTLLAGLWHPQGAQLVADILLHSVIPALYLVDFLIAPPREAARWSTAWKALIFPAVYGAWSLLHGAFSGFYPYPFLDVPKHGYGAVLVNLLVMGIGFYLLTLAMTGLQHLQRRLASSARRPISA